MVLLCQSQTSAMELVSLCFMEVFKCVTFLLARYSMPLVTWYAQHNRSLVLTWCGTVLFGGTCWYAKVLGTHRGEGGPVVVPTYVGPPPRPTQPGGRGRAPGNPVDS